MAKNDFERYKKVIWLLREKYKPRPGTTNQFHVRDLKRAIYQEIGSDPRTEKRAMYIMKDLKIIKRQRNRWWVIDTGEVE